MSPIQDTDLFPLRQGGTTYRAAAAQLKAGTTGDVMVRRGTSNYRLSAASLATVGDADILPVGRGGQPYRVSGADLKAYLAPPPSTLDPDAQAWITRVEAADGQALEAAFRTAVSDLVIHAKATTSTSVGGGTLWSRINNWILFSGPRTVAGAIVVPLKGGVQPVGVNLTAGLHTRRGGIQGTTTLRIETGVALPAGLPLAGGVFVTAPPAVGAGTHWGDSQSMPPPFMLGLGGAASVTPTDSGYFGRWGEASSTILISVGANNVPFNPHGMEHIGAVALERTLAANNTNAWDLVRDNVGLATRTNSPGVAVTTRGPVDLYSRRTGNVLPYQGQLGGFIQGSLSARECTDLLTRYQAAVAAHIP